MLCAYGAVRNIVYWLINSFILFGLARGKPTSAIRAGIYSLFIKYKVVDSSKNYIYRGNAFA